MYISVKEQGLFLEWVENYNSPYTGWNRRNRQRNIVCGFDLKMNGPKRHHYCTTHGLPFDAVIYANPIPSIIGMIPKEKDFDVFIGTRVDFSAGGVQVPAGSVQYMVAPNVTVNPVGAPYMAQTVPFNTVGASPHVSPQMATIPPGGAPYASPSPHMAPPSDPGLAPYPPQAPPSAPSYDPTEAAPPSYEESQKSQFHQC